MGGAAALVAGITATAPVSAAVTAESVQAATPSSRGEQLKRLMRERREAAQMHALPSAIPGAERNFDPGPLGSFFAGFTPKVSITSNDEPTAYTKSKEEAAKVMGGFLQLAVSPTILGYGPMLAEGDVLVEEWESQIYASNNTVYNNQYLVIFRFDGDDMAEFHEYNDSLHASLIFGPPGNWPRIPPPTNPRRRNRSKFPGLDPTKIQTVFEITDEFNLDPKMLRDPVPSASAPPAKFTRGIEGNKALVKSLRKAKASGDQAAVNSFYGKGFHHFIAGERPFGWDHLPLADIYAPLAKHLKGPLKVMYGPMVADESRVFEQMDVFARLDDGTVYNNWYAFIHEIRDGKIVQTREYQDTLHTWIVLGRWAAWGSTPVPPRSSPRRSNLEGIALTTQNPMMSPLPERYQPFPTVG
jgi:ketosteroid isomerase-like protein